MNIYLFIYLLVLNEITISNRYDMDIFAPKSRFTEFSETNIR